MRAVKLSPFFVAEISRKDFVILEQQLTPTGFSHFRHAVRVLGVFNSWRCVHVRL
jgi:hypothetical protein